MQYHVLFKGLPAEEGTWIDVMELHRKAPLMLYRYKCSHKPGSPIERFITIPGMEEDLGRIRVMDHVEIPVLRC